MSRATVLFGNGLGKAVDPGYFDLATALDYAWGVDGDAALNTDDKCRIARCVNLADINIAPKSEAELDQLQRVISACDFLNSVGDQQVHWLSNAGQLFPDSVRKYLGRAASHFHDFPGELPCEFLDSLCAFIRRRNANVATLNYDKLLYKPFIDRNLCSGYNSYLVDGFWVDRNGFTETNIARMYSNTFGWYLHLHGSPLFADQPNGTINKVRQSDLSWSHHLRKHLILTHHSFKPGLIQHSRVLRTYWEYFNFSLHESSELICFGYSGDDTHVNNVIASYAFNNQKKVTVVEWSGAGDRGSRESFWTNTFKNNIQLVQLNDILSYRFDLSSS